MTKRQYTLAYELFNTDNLKRFILGRRLVMPANGSGRKAYIHTLRTADRNATFIKFFDLAPELRNLVYKELLTLHSSSNDSDRGFCWPNVFRASRQIHQEAQGLLYSENAIDIVFKLFKDCAWHDGWVRPAASAHVNGAQVPMSTWRMLHRPLHWSPFLLRAYRLRIRLDVIEAWPSHFPAHPLDPYWLASINHAMYDLHSFMLQAQTLKGIEVVCSAKDTPIADDVLQKVLFPLTLLSANTTLDGVSDEVKSSFMNAVQANGGGVTPGETDVLTEWRRMANSEWVWPSDLNAQHRAFERWTVAETFFDPRYQPLEKALVTEDRLRRFAEIVDSLRAFKAA